MVRKDIRRTRVLGSIGIVLCALAFIVITLLILESPEPLPEEQGNQTQEQSEENKTEEAAPELNLPKQKLLYVLHNTPSMLSIVDLELNHTIKEIPLSNGPHEMFYDQLTNDIYITNKAANTITVVNREKNEIVRTIKGGSSPEGIIVTDKKVYVTNPGEQVVLVINKALGSIDKEIQVGQNPSHMLLSQDQRKLYVLNRGSDDITIINTNIDAFIDVWFAGDNPERFAINAHERFMYVSNADSNTLSVIDLQQKQRIAEFPVGKDPQRLLLFEI